MSKSTISTFELFRMFPDQESARVYFEARRWPDGATCPACGEAILEANRGLGDEPPVLPAGLVITLPDLTQAAAQAPALVRLWD